MIQKMSVVMLGVGNSLHSDDGAGPVLAEELKNEGMNAFNCGTAPENFTSSVRRLHPETLIIVDAALMGLNPGTIRRIPADKIHDTAVGTHMMSLAFLADYLKEEVSEIIFIGIEPESLEFGDGLSNPVKEAVAELKHTILHNEYKKYSQF